MPVNGVFDETIGQNEINFDKIFDTDTNGDTILDAATTEPTEEQTANVLQLADKLAETQIQPQFVFRKPKQKVREHKKIGRNDPCPCGSGKKYKNCCLSSGEYENLVDA